MRRMGTSVPSWSVAWISEMSRYPNRGNGTINVLLHDESACLRNRLPWKIPLHRYLLIMLIYCIIAMCMQ